MTRAMAVSAVVTPAASSSRTLTTPATRVVAGSRLLLLERLGLPGQELSPHLGGAGLDIPGLPLELLVEPRQVEDDGTDVECALRGPADLDGRVGYPFDHVEQVPDGQTSTAPDIDHVRLAQGRL